MPENNVLAGLLTKMENYIIRRNPEGRAPPGDTARQNFHIYYNRRQYEIILG